MLRRIALSTLSTAALFATGDALHQDVVQEAPYGSWRSPITAEAATRGMVVFSEVQVAGEKLYWLEGRPEEDGRVALVSWSPEEGEKDLLPKNYSPRTRVYEYGGGVFIRAGERLYFVDSEDQQIHSINPDGTVNQITFYPGARFADGCAHPDGLSLFYLMEDQQERILHSIVQIDLASGAVTKLASGNDFYSNPRISKDGQQLAYLTWNQPNMPWDGTELWVYNLVSGESRLVAGGLSESIADPKWSEDNQLIYISDRSDWWNLYRDGSLESIWAVEGEWALPQWWMARSLVGFSTDGMVGSYVQNGLHVFAKISHDGEATPLQLPYTCIKSLSVEGSVMAMIASSPSDPSSIVLYNLSTGELKVVKSACKECFDDSLISQPIAVEFPTAGDRTAHGFYYPPCNPHFRGTPSEKPPLLVHAHGGPTGHFSPLYSPNILYWTSRGFAVMVVNYGGSTGYGRPYRDRLKGEWGVVDVDDCTHAALYCVEQGLADPDRLAIEGGSAGGFTTLAALAFRSIFHVGADHFGVSDMVTMNLDTHKFEARYQDHLVGPYPEAHDLYIERSPLYHTHQITRPIIIFQGAEDKIVPPSQSDAIYASLLAQQIPTAYFLYEGEGHGFRKQQNLQKTLEAQHYFFAKALGLPIPNNLPLIDIQNAR